MHTNIHLHSQATPTTIPRRRALLGLFLFASTIAALLRGRLLVATAFRLASAQPLFARRVLPRTTTATAAHKSSLSDFLYPRPRQPPEPDKMDYAAAMESVLQKEGLPMEDERDLDPLLEAIGDKRFVFLGEASHGTHEYYIWRAQLSKRLIEEKGFNFIAIEGDWPDCFQINKYVKGFHDAAKSPVDIVRHFKRWPTFMLGNLEIAALASTLREINNKRAPKDRVGFYGLDVYSLLDSLESILAYLKKVDGEQAVRTAERALHCFQRVTMSKEDVGQSYGMAATMTPYSCRDEVVDLLVKVRQEAAKVKAKEGGADEEAVEDAFAAEINTRVAIDAERYYKVMVDGSDESWNIRDRHMQDTLERLVDFYGPNSKAIIWEHNTHIGDATATDMGASGLVNIGQLARERWGPQNTMLIGLGSAEGTVMAGKHWGAPMEVMPLPECKPGTWEDICRKASKARNMLILPDTLKRNEFTKRIGHRAVGVVYKPINDYRQYVPSIMRHRYDAFIHLDTTRALHALKTDEVDLTEIPDLYPWGV